MKKVTLLLIFLWVVICGVIIYFAVSPNPFSGISQGEEIFSSSLTEDMEDAENSSGIVPSFEEDYYAGLEEFFNSEENYYETIQGEYGFIQ